MSISLFRRPSVLPLTAAILAFSQAEAAVIYDEASQGDLSNSNTAPTPLVLSAGQNVIRGVMGGTGGADDPDFMRLTVAPGLALTGLQLDELAVVDGALGTLGVFTAISIGPTIRMDIEAGEGRHLSNAFARGPKNLLADFADGSFAGGLPAFSTPLPSGTYTLWIQEMTARVSYQFTITTAPVPEPATAGFVGLALAAMLSTQRARRPA